MLSKDKFTEKQETSMFSTQNSNEIEFSLNQDAYGAIIDRLTDVYDSPAIAAAREVISNAYDATVSYEQTHGKKGSIAIELPVMENDYNFVVEDNAAGMSMDVLIQNYCTYGNSVKIDDMLVTGSKGMGAKAPFAAVSTFHIETSDGEKTISATAVRTAGEVPRLVDVKTVDANGAHGTKITIPTKKVDNSISFDVARIAMKMANFIVGYDVVVKNKEDYLTENPLEQAPLGLENYVHIANVEHMGHDLRLFVKNTVLTREIHGVSGALMDETRHNSYGMPLSSGNIDVLLNGYVYTASGYVHRQRADYLLEIIPGIVDFPSSRDTIVKNHRFNELINSASETRIDVEKFSELFAVYLSSAVGGKYFIENLRFYSKTYPKLFKLTKELNGKTVLDGIEVNIREEVLTALEAYGEENKHELRGVFYSEGIVGNKAFELNFELSRRKTESNKKFRELIETQVLADEKDAHTSNTCTLSDFIEENSVFKGDIVAYSGKDEDYLKLTSKTSRMKIAVTGENSVIMFVPFQGKLSKEDKKTLNAAAWIMNKKVYFKDSLDSEDYISIQRSSAPSTRTLYSYHVKSFKDNKHWEDSKVSDEQTLFDFTNAFESTGTLFYGNRNVNYITREVEESLELGESNLEVLVLPSKMHSRADNFEDLYCEHILSLAEKHGVEYALNTEVFILEEPSLAFTQELESIGAKVSVYTTSKGRRYRAQSYNDRAKVVQTNPLRYKALVAGIPQDKIYAAAAEVFSRFDGYLRSYEFSSLSTIVDTVKDSPELGAYEIVKDLASIEEGEDVKYIESVFRIINFVNHKEINSKEFFEKAGVDIEKVEDVIEMRLALECGAKEDTVALRRTADLVDSKALDYLVELLVEEDIAYAKKKAASNYITKTLEKGVKLRALEDKQKFITGFDY